MNVVMALYINHLEEVFLVFGYDMQMKKTNPPSPLLQSGEYVSC